MEHGVPMGIKHELMEEKAKQDFKEHSCFREPQAIINCTIETLKEVEKGHIIGPFDIISEVWNGERLIMHRTGMVTRKGEP